MDIKTLLLNLMKACKECGSDDLLYGEFDYYKQKQLFCQNCKVYYYNNNGIDFKWNLVTHPSQLTWGQGVPD